MAPGRSDPASSRSRAGHGADHHDRHTNSGQFQRLHSAGVDDEHNMRSSSPQRQGFNDGNESIGAAMGAGQQQRGGSTDHGLQTTSSRDTLGQSSASPVNGKKMSDSSSGGSIPFWKRKKSEQSKKKDRVVARVTWKDKLRDRISALYQLIIIETILRRKPLPPSRNGRHIPLNATDVGNKGLIDERSEKPYVSNFIRSSRYTIWTFIPAQLIYQFSKLGNFYFLVMGILQLIPNLSTVGTWTTIAPLGVFVALSMLKEGFDDWRRYQLDKVENRSMVWVLGSGIRGNTKNRPLRLGSKGAKHGETEDDEKKRRDLEASTDFKLDVDDWIKIQWQHVQVGDVVRLHRDEAIPADVALLHATGPNGIAYIDTMALDGETNLKAKQACSLLAERCATTEGLKSTNATIVSEDPNLDLYSYDGQVLVDDETLPLTMANVVYRGSTLRNTKMATGLVINTGEECKIRMNANKNIKAKKPRMQSSVNMMILIQLCAVCILAAGMTIGYALWKNETEQNSFYIRDATVPFVQIFFGYLIMFNTLVPISLYISLEIVKVGQYFLMQDAEMYDPVSDTRMVVNTTTILENLGQVDYVFSDKTGTLTENIMRFRKMSIAGVACLHDMDVDRDEETRTNKIQESQQRRKGGAKQKTKNLLALIPDTFNAIFQERDYKILKEERERQQRPTPARAFTDTSMSQWKPKDGSDGEPEMKTEDLLDLIQRKPDTPFARKAKFFILCIALCHTCLPEEKDDGTIAFQAANPDELALTEAARDMGYLLIDRPANAIKLQTKNPDGTTHIETYQVLDVVEFSSKRKRMSIIVRMPDGRICVICKGADNVIRERLRLRHLAEQKAQDIDRRSSQRRSLEQSMIKQHRQSYHEDYNSPRGSMTINRRDSYNPRNSLARVSTELSQDPRRNFSRMKSYDSADRLVDDNVATTDAATFERCFQQVDDFASEGLRTLLYGFRYIDEDSYAKWKKIYHEAETSLVDRQERIEEASDLIEQKFDLAGATAIEDKLQEGVPETIEKLRRANIKVWMLTGDKRETAINIGHSAKLCKSYSSIYVLDVTMGDLQGSLQRILDELHDNENIPHSVLVVDGGTLTAIDNDADLAILFYDIVILVDSVICCRASPSQKAHLVKTIRRYMPKSMTLAVGDGANDIGMILASQVGVGISGREGLQAARISDYSIAQFRFLQKLLFVHGRWNYVRTGRYILATFWKEIIFYIVQAHFQRSNGYSGTSLYENWSLTVFNVLFTSLAVIIPGIFEKDLSQDTLLEMPELYSYGQKNMGFNYGLYFMWALMAAIGSVIIYYPTWWFYGMTLFTEDTSLYAMGVVCFTVTVVFINIKLFILETHHKTIIIFFCCAISIGGWFMWLAALSETYPAEMAIYLVYDGFIHHFGPTLAFWTIILLELGLLLLLDLVVQSVRRVYFPNDVDLMQRIEKDEAKARRKGRKAQMVSEAEMGKADGDLEMESMQKDARYPPEAPAQREDMIVEEGRGRAEDENGATRSMAWSGNADYYYNNVDSRPPPVPPQPTYQGSSQPIGHAY